MMRSCVLAFLAGALVAAGACRGQEVKPAPGDPLALAVSQPLPAELGPGLRSAGVTQQQVLDEVNALRAQRGMPPYQLDPRLAEGALRCACYRAANRTSGHTESDFRFLPPGAHATSAGCAAWPPHLGWGSCDIYEHARYAGAGFCVGSDGLRYMHLFIR